MEGTMACSGVRLRGSFERLFRPLGFGARISLMPIDCREHSSSTEGDRIADEERGDDERMLELLEPFRGHRGRVLRWILAAGRHPPRRAPRSRLRSLPRADGPLR